MEGFLICMGKRTKLPFFIYETKTNIYSAEELCYYIYNNIEILDDKMFGPSLIEFFRRCERADIAAYLEQAIATKGVTTELMIRDILSKVNYYSKAEIDKLCIKLRALAGKPVEERLKAMGDALLRNKKYAMAEKAYRKLIDMGVGEYKSTEFCSGLWYNLGVLYARMLYVSLAKECFTVSYEIYPDIRTKKMLTLTNKLLNNEDYFETVKSEELASSWEEEWAALDAKVSEELMQNGEARACVNLYEEGEVATYQENVRVLIGKWKQEYREQMK